MENIHTSDIFNDIFNELSMGHDDDTATLNVLFPVNLTDNDLLVMELLGLNKQGSDNE